MFLTLCAKADPEGFVSATVDGIRRTADMPVADVQRHLDILASPDLGSKDRERDPLADGRRIEKVTGGWRVLNIQWYRELARQEAERARKRKWWQENRSGKAPLDATLDDPPSSARRTETETETGSDLDPSDRVTPAEALRKGRKRKTQLPSDWEPSRTPAILKLEAAVQNVASELEQFKDRAIRDGATYSNWDAAWRTWLRNVPKFTPRSRQDAPGSRFSEQAPVGSGWAPDASNRAWPPFARGLLAFEATENGFRRSPEFQACKTAAELDAAWKAWVKSRAAERRAS